MREISHKAHDEEKVSKLGVLTFLCVFFIIAIEGIDLSTLAVSLAVIMEDFDLTSVEGGMLFSISTAGMMTGGIISGSLSDRFGRLKMTKVSTLIFTVFICLSTIVDEFAVFCIIRFISSAGMAGAWASGVVMVSEFIPTKIRNTALAIIQGGNCIGSVVATLMNGMITPLYGWRPVVMIAVASGAAALFLTRYLEEPPSYVACSKKKVKKNKTKGSVRILLSDKGCRRNLIKWMAGSIFMMGGYYAANSWLPTYMTNEFEVDFQVMTYFIAGNYAMMFTGRLAAGILSDKFGRKRVWFTACMCTSALLPVIILLANSSNVGVLILLFGLFYGTPMAMSSTFMSESFPTECRGSGTALAYNGGRIGSMMSTVLIGLFVTKTGSFTTGFVMIAAAYLLCGAVVFFIKEKQYDPEEIIE